MQTEYFRKKLVELFPVFIMALALVLIKIPHLTLPHYWDEAWPFAAAINHLYEYGIRMLPDAVPSNISRGHPLLFHVLTASWMKIFGDSLIAKNTFPLVISVILLFVLYYLSKSLFNRKLAYVITFLFGIQQMFLVQSSFLLLEVMLTLWAMLVIYGFLNNKKWMYLLFGTALLLTKESGIVLIIAVLGWYFLTQLFRDYKNLYSRLFWKKLLLYLTPVLIASMYFIVQKIQLGWFFFPKHIGFMSFEWDVILNKMTIIRMVFLNESGRWILSLLFLLSVLILLWKNTSFSKNGLQINFSWFNKKHAHTMGFFLFFLVGYVLFSSLNFFSNRYLMITLPVFIMIVVYFFDSAIDTKLPRISLLVISAVILIIPSTKREKNFDVNFGFVDAVEVHHRVKEFCANNMDKNAKIYTHFLMNLTLTKPYVGHFDEGEKPFKNVGSSFQEDTDYCIFSNMEYFKAFDKVKKENNLKLIKEFKQNNAWTKIYKVVKFKHDSDGK